MPVKQKNRRVNREEKKNHMKFDPKMVDVWGHICKFLDFQELKNVREVCKPLCNLVSSNRALFNPVLFFNLANDENLSKFLVNYKSIIKLASKTFFNICLEVPPKIVLDPTDENVCGAEAKVNDINNMIFYRTNKLIEVCGKNIVDLLIPENTPKIILDTILVNTTGLTRLVLHVDWENMKPDNSRLFAEIIKNNVHLEELIAKDTDFEGIKLNKLQNLIKIQLETCLHILKRVK